MKENRRLKEELQIMFSKLQNYEREIGGSLLGGGDWQLYLGLIIEVISLFIFFEFLLT